MLSVVVAVDAKFLVSVILLAFLTMDLSNALQEQQVVLMEAMNRRLESIQEGQKNLEETNAALRKENDFLKTQLERQQPTNQSRRCKRKQSRTSVEIPSDLGVSTCLYSLFCWSVSVY